MIPLKPFGEGANGVETMLARIPQGRSDSADRDQIITWPGKWRRLRQRSKVSPRTRTGTIGENTPSRCDDRRRACPGYPGKRHFGHARGCPPAGCQLPEVPRGLSPAKRTVRRPMGFAPTGGLNTASPGPVGLGIAPPEPQWLFSVNVPNREPYMRLCCARRRVTHVPAGGRRASEVSGPFVQVRLK